MKNLSNITNGSEAVAKIAKIVVHPGIFHADDVCVVAYLRLLGCLAPVERRTPSQEEMEDPTVLVADVGGRYEISAFNFDHHQKGGAGNRGETGVAWASFGLVYDAIQPFNSDIAACFEKRVVEPVDATDCGWGTVEGTRPGLSFSATVAGFNPSAGATGGERDKAFEKAVEFAKQVLANEMRHAEELVAAKTVVLEAATALDKRVLVLERFVPWSDHLFRRDDQECLLYVVYPSERGGFCLQQVPVEAGSMAGRRPLPAEWAGLRSDELAGRLGLSSSTDSVFCHPGRFIGGADTYDDVMIMAALAVA